MQSSQTSTAGTRFALWLLAAFGWIGVVGAQGTVDFDRQIEPIFQKHCLECHGAKKQKNGLRLDRRASALKGGDSGKPAISPHNPSESELIRRVFSGDPDEWMPPKGDRLSQADTDLLKRWVTEGAPWGKEVEAASNGPGDDRHWAFQPIKRLTPPVVKNAAWASNPIDRFILAKLEAAGLSPAVPADKEAWLRRATFDLHGLPPSPAEIDAFLADNSPEAFERVIDRLLASPRYGERWARHWMDLARFGESDGFEYDHMRPNAWPYRDYLIESFNEDKPYTQFVLEQLAGDVIESPTHASLAATGFLVGGPYDMAGNNSASESLKARVREEEMEDIISAVGQTFLALTVNCARCHDHKFDPIPQEDYYRIKAALDGVRRGERNWLTTDEEKNLTDQAEDCFKKITALEEEKAALEKAGRDALIQHSQPSPAAIGPQPIARWTFESDARDIAGALHGTLHGDAKVANGRLLLNGKDAFLETAPVPKTLREKTLEAWVMIGDSDQRGGGIVSVESDKGGRFDAIVFGERQPRKWIAGSEFFHRTRDLNAPIENSKSNDLVHVAVVYHADNSITLYRDGAPYGEAYVPAESTGTLQTFGGDGAHILIGLRHTGAQNGFFKGEIEEARLYDKALSDEEIRVSAKSIGQPIITPEACIAALTPAMRERYAAVSAEVAAVRKTQTKLADKPQVYAVLPRKPRPTYILARGEPDKRRGEATAGAISAVTALPCDFGLNEDSPEGQRRLKLAEWINAPQNPLTARVIVNRVWHYHFGRGIVGTPSDFGVNGERPSHPELLDWLADEFLSHGGSLKYLHHLIMTSAVYRQASMLPAEKKSHNEVKSAAMDAENRLLWHFPSRRLDAESVRDALLSASGLLNTAEGGPGFRPFKVTVSGSSFYELIDATGPEFNRRAVYRMNILSGKDPLMDSFDCPDPATKTPARSITTTPIQALGLMNNPFVLRQAEYLAARVKSEAGNRLADQIRRAYRLVFGRLPKSSEFKLAETQARNHGLASLCWVLVNSSEFVYLP